MIFASSLFNKPFKIQENEIPVLVLENKKCFREFVLALMDENENYSDEFSFYLNDEEIDTKKDIELITDVFSLDINKSRNITKLYNYIKSNYINEEKYEQTQKLILYIKEYINDVISDVDFQLAYTEDIDVSNILKAIDLQFEDDEVSLLNRLIDYIKIIHDFMGKKIILITNFKNVFSNNEQAELYKFIQYNKINLLLVESVQPNCRIEHEIYRIIDEDLCVIY